MTAGIQGFGLRSTRTAQRSMGIDMGTRQEEADPRKPMDMRPRGLGGIPGIPGYDAASTRTAQRGMGLDMGLRKPADMRPRGLGGIPGIPSIDTGNRSSGRGIGIPSYDVATTNWQNQVGKARLGGIAADGRRLDGTGRGLFTRDRVTRQPTQLERETQAQIGIVRAQNEGIFGGENIRADASRFSAGAGLAAAGMQDKTTRRGQGLETGLGIRRIDAERENAARTDETTRRGQGLEFGARTAATSAERDIASITDKTTRRGQGLDFKAKQEATAVERERIAAERQSGGLPGLVQHNGTWYAVDPITGKAERIPDADQPRMTTVRRLADSFPQSVKREELDAFAQDPTSIVPVYDYQTGRVALKPVDTSPWGVEDWPNTPIGKGKQARLRYQPLAEFEPLAYQAFMEWANPVN